MKLAVIGSRNFNSYPLVEKTLDEFPAIELIVSGGAKGADQLAERYAKERNIPVQLFRPDYNQFESKVAPIVRNRQIVDHADYVVAFWDGKSHGTGSVIEYAKKNRKQLKIIAYGEPEKIESEKSISVHRTLPGGQGLLF